MGPTTGTSGKAEPRTTPTPAPGTPNDREQQRPAYAKDRPGQRESRTGRREGQVAEREGQVAYRESPTGHRRSQVAQREGQVAQRESRTAHETQAAQRDSRTGHREPQGEHREIRTAHREPRAAQRESRTAHREPQGAQRDSRTAHREPQATQQEIRTAQRDSQTPNRKSPAAHRKRPAAAHRKSQPAHATTPARTPRLIRSDSTTEIPLDLLFRDDTGTVPAASDAVVGRRRGTGEQVRPSAARAAVPMRVTVPVEVTERRGRSWPGAAAVAAGFTGLAGCAAGGWWAGALPEFAVRLARLPEQLGAGLGPAQWAVLAGSGALALFSFGGLGRGREGRAWVLSLFGRYRGSVRRTGLVWVNPLLKRRRVDVRLRHWRSEPMPGVDAHGVALRVVLLVVWRVKDTARAALGVDDPTTYLRECVEAALAGVLSQLPVDAPTSGAGGATLRNAEAVGDALTRRVAADAEAAGVEVFAVRPTRIDYAPEVADSVRRRRLAALEARERDTALSRLVDSVEDTVTRLTVRGLVELDDCERKALVKDLTVAFCAGQNER